MLFYTLSVADARELLTPSVLTVLHQNLLKLTRNLESAVAGTHHYMLGAC